LLPWRLGFDIADDEVLAVPHAKVGVAGFRLLGQLTVTSVLAPFFEREAGKQGLWQRRVKGFLASVAAAWRYPRYLSGIE
jgi:hypothetical protein